MYLAIYVGSSRTSLKRSSSMSKSRHRMDDELHLFQTSSSITLLGNTNNLLLADTTLSCSPHQSTSASHRDIRFRDSMEDSHNTASSAKLHRSTTPLSMMPLSSISEVSELSDSSPVIHFAQRRHNPTQCKSTASIHQLARSPQYQVVLRHGEPSKHHAANLTA